MNDFKVGDKVKVTGVSSRLQTTSVFLGYKGTVREVASDKEIFPYLVQFTNGDETYFDAEELSHE